MLGYHLGHADGAGDRKHSLEREVRRRCFWACWVSSCIAAQSNPHLSSAWSEAANIPLPAAVHSTGCGWEVAVGQQMTADWLPVSGPDPQDVEGLPSIAASMVKLVGVWYVRLHTVDFRFLMHCRAKIQLFVGESSDLPREQREERLKSLSNLATSIYDNDPALSRRSDLQNNADSAYLHQLLLVDALYHMCQVALHSIAMPYFSPSSESSSVDNGSLQKTARIVLLHARLFTTVLRSILHSFDITYISSLTGYGAFMAGAVLIAIEVSVRRGRMNGSQLDPNVMAGSDRVSTAEEIAGVLSRLCNYWKVLRIPVSVVSNPYLCGHRKPDLKSLILYSRKG